MGKVYLAKSRSGDHFYAVKRAKLLDENSRRTFHTELQVWIELPEHPQLVACRFFRTIGDETVVFAQYIEGGTLHDWIRSRRLMTVPQILDVAIQMAWGLHVLHELGLVHHDMKSSNVLMTSDGIAKITDFGLAKARASAGEQPSTQHSRNSIMVSSGGFTLAFRSPEQAAGRQPACSTDIWSWAVTVLEMFAGEVTWWDGQAADEAFEEYCASLPSREKNGGIAAMPRAIAMIVKKCLRRNPKERWPNLLIVAEELRKVYKETAGRPYTRPTPPFPKRSKPVKSQELREPSSTAYEWLCLAYSAAGRGRPNRHSSVSICEDSVKVQAIADLAQFDEAQRMIQSLIEAGRRDLQETLAALCFEKARAHSEIDDSSGELVCYDRAIDLYRGMVNAQVKAPEFVVNLGTALSVKAQALYSLCELRAADTTVSEAIDIFELLLQDGNDSLLLQRLASAYQCKGNTAYDMADYATALHACDRVIDIYGRLRDRIGEPQISVIMAGAYMHKGNVIWSSGDPRGALVWHDKTIEIWDRLLKSGRTQCARDLAKAYYNKAITLRTIGDLQQARDCHDRAIEHYERLVHEEKRQDIANELANVYNGRANAMRDLGQSRESLSWYEKAIEIYDALVNQQGRQDVAGDLAAIRGNFAVTLLNLNECDKGMLEAERAIPALEREIARTGRSFLESVLADVRAHMRQNAIGALEKQDVYAPDREEVVKQMPEVDSGGESDRFSFGKVISVKDGTITLVEYDFGKDADVHVVYRVTPATEYGNIESLSELNPGDDVVLDFVLKGSKRLVTTLVKEMNDN